MSNIYPHELDNEMNKIYDLKGSSRNDFGDCNRSISKQPLQLKEIGFVNDYVNGLQLSPKLYNKLKDILKNDTNFLVNSKFVEYSVLLITEEPSRDANNNLTSGKSSSQINNGIVVYDDDHRFLVFIGIIDILQSFTIPRRLEYCVATVANALNYHISSIILDPQNYARRLYKYITELVCHFELFLKLF